MANRDKSYWEQRQAQKYLAGEKLVNEYYKGLIKAFEQAKKEIRIVINDFYVRYAEGNALTFEMAQRQLNKTELGELQEFIDLVYQHMGAYNQKVVNMSIRARITRYQALEMQIDAILQQLYAIEYQYKGEEMLKNVYSDAYYRTWFNIDQYYGFHQEFAQVNPRTIDELIRYPFNGADFSSRIWKQKDHMLQVLTEDITTMLVQGRNPQTLARDFARRFKTKEFEAYRLLHTESSFVIEQGSLAAYKEDGVEKYQILATLDMKTSDICREQDGKVYDVDKATVGVNYPPFHPFCRTTTVPYYEDVENEGTRVARDPKSGKSYEVPANMKYKEWKEKFVDGTSTELYNDSLLKESKDSVFEKMSKEYSAEYKEKLTYEEIEAIRKYQSTWYLDMNNFLRGRAESVSRKTKTYIKNLQKAIEKVKIKENILVARGTTVSAIGGDWDAALINDIITDEGFISTSLREEMAIDFANRKGERGILMYVKIPKGTNGVIADVAVNDNWESELLLAPGTKTRITGKRIENGMKIVEGVVVNE